MKRAALLIVLVLVVTIGLVSTDQEAKAASRFGYTPASLIYKFEAAGASIVKQIQITNTTDGVQTYTAKAEQYRIMTPEEIASGKRYADIAWITITPEQIEIPAGMSGYVNVAVDLPEGTEEARYITYIRLFDGMEQNYVAVGIYIGAAIPVHSYMIDPGWFKLEAKGDGDRWSKELAIQIKNTGTADANYKVWGRLPDDPTNIDPEYKVGHPDWVEVVTPKVYVKAGESGEAKFKVHVPSDVDPGKYKIWVGIRDNDQEAQIQIEYASKLFVDVMGGEGVSNMEILGIILGFAGVVLLGGALTYGVRRWAARPEKDSPTILKGRR